MAGARCDGSRNAFTGETIPCGWSLSGLPDAIVTERGLAHQDKMGNHSVRFDLDSGSDSI